MLSRKTIIFNQVINILKTTHHPLSVNQIMDILNKKELNPNKTTIYRMMEKLLDKDAIAMTTFNNGVNYYFLSSNKHHHHFFCNSCHTLFCLSNCPIDSLNINISSLLPNDNFKVTTHDFNLYGTCERCSKTSVKT